MRRQLAAALLGAALLTGGAQAVAEPTAARYVADEADVLSSETEQYIQQQLRELPFPCTKVIIAQRVSSMIDADLILVLKDGRIAERGTHEELLRSCPEYLEIAKSQLSAKELGLDDAANEASALDASALEGGER